MSENSIPKVGSLPGSLEYTGNLSDVVTEISVVTYDHDSYRIEKDFDLKTYQPQEALGQNTWVRFVGLSDVEKISVIGKAFELDELTLEDILSVKQRPGMNYSQNQIFSACKMFYFEKDTKLLRLRQISFILKAGVLLTFEERAESCISTIFDRLKYDQNKVRRKSIDYLFYLLHDTIIDSYYYSVRKLSDEFLDIESQLTKIQTLNGFQRIHHLRNQINTFTKYAVPIKDVTNMLYKCDSRLLRKNLKPYLKDLHDQSLDIVDTLNSLEGKSATLLEILISLNSFKMNEVIKALTIISTIFLPLTFIVGLYGMNFRYMPELDWKYGYFVVLGLMSLLLTFMIVFIKRRNWL